MGVPVVSHPGDRPSGRTGASLLKSAGLNYLCATNEKDYIGVATAIASDPLSLGTLRKQLRTKVLNSTLCDTNSWTRKLENILLKTFKERNSITNDNTNVK
jgi:predicted O-linked N-acetylglucosamine transferase (SPINDLY family)